MHYVLMEPDWSHLSRSVHIKVFGGNKLFGYACEWILLNQVNCMLSNKNDTNYTYTANHQIFLTNFLSFLSNIIYVILNFLCPRLSVFTPFVQLFQAIFFISLWFFGLLWIFLNLLLNVYFFFKMVFQFLLQKLLSKKIADYKY